MVAESHPQKPLVLPLENHYTLERFIDQGNEEAFALLKKLLHRETAYPVWFLWGAGSCGKTHLLRSLSKAAQDKHISSIYLDLSQPGMQQEVLYGLEDYQQVYLDHLDAVTGQYTWQEALFHLVNRMMTNKSVLILASRNNLPRQGLQLADLASRLAWGICLQLNELDESKKQLLLQQYAASLGFVLADEVAAYLLKHHSRDLKKLLALLIQLDKASLSEQKKVTIPFVRRCLG